MTNKSLSINNRPLPNCCRDLILLLSGPDNKINPIISLIRYSHSFIFYTDRIINEDMLSDNDALKKIRYPNLLIFFIERSMERIIRRDILSDNDTLEEFRKKLYIYIGMENKLKNLFNNINDPTIKARFLTTLFDLGYILPIYKDFKKEIVEYQYYLELHNLSAETIALIKEVLPIYCKDMNNTPPRNL